MNSTARAAAILLAGLLVGCWSPTPSPAPAKRGVSLGDVAPEINAYDLEGQAGRLSDYRGKVVLLDFWQSG